MTKQYTFSEFVTKSYDIRRTVTLTEDELKSLGIDPDDVWEILDTWLDTSEEEENA